MANQKKENANLQEITSNVTTELFATKISDGDYIIGLGREKPATFIHYILLKLRKEYELIAIVNLPDNCHGMSYHIGAENLSEKELPYHMTEYVSGKDSSDDRKMILVWKINNTTNDRDAFAELGNILTEFAFYD